MPVEHGSEHRARQVIRVVELHHLMRLSVQQGRVAHAQRYVSVAEADVRTAHRIDARRSRQTHE